MSYKANSTKYGAKTKAQIDALTGMSQGDDVFNTDINRIEYYSGSIWLNDDLIAVKIDSAGGTYSEGDSVAWTDDATYQKAVELAIDTNSDEWAGVVYRGGTGAGTEIAIAWKGTYPCNFGTGAANAGNCCILSTSTGEFQSSGTAQVGCIGLVAETIGAPAGNAKVIIGGVETF